MYYCHHLETNMDSFGHHNALHQIYYVLLRLALAYTLKVLSNLTKLRITSCYLLKNCPP
eukprot:c23684_g1_i2 orf=490-666(-)